LPQELVCFPLHGALPVSLSPASPPLKSMADAVDDAGHDAAPEGDLGSVDTQLQPTEGVPVGVKSHPDGPIGVEVWPASRVMLKWMCSAAEAPRWKDKTILELGSGCGALSMGLVSTLGAARTYASDGDPEVLEVLRENVTLNQLDGLVVPCLWDWEESMSAPTEVDLESVDLIVASDVVYVGTAECRLSHALATLCKGDGDRTRDAWFLLADRPRGGEDFGPPLELDEGVNTELCEDGTMARPTATGRFLLACGRRGLQVDELDLDPNWIKAATAEAGVVGTRREFEGSLRLFHIHVAVKASS